MKPRPVIVTTICSECGWAWEAHGASPTTADCIRLLKVELAKRPAPITVTYPTYPFYQPYVYPYNYQYTWTSAQQNTSGYSQAINCTYNTPAISTTTITSTAA